MLELLHIENIAVIQDRRTSSSDPGFNALTGETGAGKSIVIDAIGAVLGERTSRDLIRTGADIGLCQRRAFTGVPGAGRVGGDRGMPRTRTASCCSSGRSTADGKNVCRVNGRPVTVAQLRRTGAAAAEHPRPARRPAAAGRGAAPGAIWTASAGRRHRWGGYRAAYEAMADLRRKIAGSPDGRGGEGPADGQPARFQIDELERAQLVPGEEESLTERRDLLRNAGEVHLRRVGGGLLP